MDGMDAFIYSLVLVPSLTELLPASGIPATPGNVGFYGSLLFSLFMIGWGMALVWGPIADRFGRVRTLMFTILWFSAFTLLGAFATTVWMLAVFRILAGVGIGGEWSIGASLVSEAWPEERRTWGVALMHTGFYFGFFLAALANYFVGANFGWRWMFVVGGLPALLVAVIRGRVEEPQRWQDRRQQLGERLTMARSFRRLFTPEYRRRTILNSFYLLASIIGLWGGSVYVPTAMTYIATREGQSAADAARLASYCSALLGAGTILGALAVPALANRLGRKVTLGIFFALMGLFIYVAFGRVFYMQAGAIPWFLVLSFCLGFGGANWIVYSFWLAEQYVTECRVSAFAFVSNVGRFVGAGFTFLVGAGISYYGSLGVPVALTSLVMLAAILLLPFGVETKGRALPE
jgi:MFS family permease